MHRNATVQDMDSDRLAGELQEIIDDCAPLEDEGPMPPPAPLTLVVGNPLAHSDDLRRWHRRLCRNLGFPFTPISVRVSSRLATRAWELHLRSATIARGVWEGAACFDRAAQAWEEALVGREERLIDRQQVADRLLSLRHTHPALLVSGLLEGAELSLITKVLRTLISERVPVDDLVTILETVLDNLPLDTTPEMHAEFVRVSLADVICEPLVNGLQTLVVMQLSSDIEELISAGIQKTHAGSFLTIDPSVGIEILRGLERAQEKCKTKLPTPVLLTAPPIRASVRKLTQRSFPALRILSWNEIPPQVNVQSVGIVKIRTGS